MVFLKHQTRGKHISFYGKPGWESSEKNPWQAKNIRENRIVRELDPKKNKIAVPLASVGLFSFSDRKSHCDDDLTGCTMVRLVIMLIYAN